MTNITPLFRSLLPNAPSSSTQKELKPKDDFLKEAYRIANLASSLLRTLRSTRTAYLSTSANANALSDTDRDVLDAESRTIIKTLLSLINQLEAAERVRIETAAAVLRRRNASVKNLWAEIRGGEGDWKRAEAEGKMVAAHRESVIAFLKQSLELGSRELQERQEIRLQRRVEMGRSVLSATKVAGAGRVGGGGWVGEQRGADDLEDEGLSQEQMRIFEKENEGLTKHYEDTLAQVKTAENSLLEISQLHTQLVSNLALQNVHIDDLLMDSLTTAENIERGNEQLKKANEKVSTARSAFLGTLVFCGVVIVWDWFI